VTKQSSNYLAPRIKVRVRPRYPEHLFDVCDHGEVEIEFMVDTRGRVRNPRVLKATHPAFARAAMDAILEWQFEPALDQGQPVEVRVRQTLVCQPVGERTEQGPYPSGLGIAELSIRPQNLAEMTTELRYDHPPKALSLVNPVYPAELLRRGVNGTARIAYLIGADGQVYSSEVLEATHPEFGLSAQAMVEAWSFEPARLSDEPTPAVQVIQQDFLSSEATGNDKIKGLLAELARPQPQIISITKLDTSPRIVERVEPSFPLRLQEATNHLTSQVVIEFFIAPDGSVLLPTAVGEPNPDLAWAAVTAVARWRFEPPKVHGRPVFARAQMPITF
jgi:TonB family protein